MPIYSVRIRYYLPERLWKSIFPALPIAMEVVDQSRIKTTKGSNSSIMSMKGEMERHEAAGGLSTTVVSVTQEQ